MDFKSASGEILKRSEGHGRESFYHFRENIYHLKQNLVRNVNVQGTSGGQDAFKNQRKSNPCYKVWEKLG